MQVIKVTSKGPMNWELSIFNCRRYLGISYAEPGYHAYCGNVYFVNSKIFSVEQLIKQIPAWANLHKLDMVAIYSCNSDAVNEELIKALEQLTLASHGNEDEHKFYFQKAYVFCETCA